MTTQNQPAAGTQSRWMFDPFHTQFVEQKQEQTARPANTLDLSQDYVSLLFV